MSDQERKPTSPVVQRVAWIGLVLGGFIGVSGHAAMGVSPAAAGVCGAVLGMLGGGLVGWFLADENGVIASIFALIGGLAGAVAGGAIVHKCGGSAAGVLGGVLAGMAVGSRIGLMINGVVKRLIVVGIVLAWVVLGPNPIGNHVRSQISQGQAIEQR